jgi:hypothetical protein
MHLVSLSKQSHALRVRGGELCPPAADDAGLSENGDCQIRERAADTRTYFLGIWRKILRRMVFFLVHAHIREYACTQF